MRILPLLNLNKHVNNRPNKTNTQLKGIDTISPNTAHTYTGNASVDLAYASMVDATIANDLKSMNLIV